MQATVLILAPEDDAHARSVAAVLNRDFGATSVIWDSEGFPARDMFSFALDTASAACHIRFPNGCDVSLSSMRSIWWRRTGKYKLHDDVTDPPVRQFCLRECDALFKGALNTLGIPIVNPVGAETPPYGKPLQLNMAVAVGLPVPKTLMSNDPQQVRAFIENSRQPSIYKAFTAPTWQMAETRILTEEDLIDLDKLRHAPIIVQEKIEKGRDVRVNVFGQRVFAAEVSTHRAEAELDWRIDLTAAWTEHCLPDHVSQKLIALLRGLGLYYGCVDLRQRPDGEYVFLEVNPSGQFLFIEIDTGQPLLHAMAELLMAPDAILPTVSVAETATLRNGLLNTSC